MTAPLAHRLAAHADHARRLGLARMEADIAEAISGLQPKPRAAGDLMQRLMTALDSAAAQGREQLVLSVAFARDIAATLAAHDARVTELLNANNCEVERRREAERALATQSPEQPPTSTADAGRSPAEDAAPAGPAGCIAPQPAGRSDQAAAPYRLIQRDYDLKPYVPLAVGRREA